MRTVHRSPFAFLILIVPLLALSCGGSSTGGGAKNENLAFSLSIPADLTAEVLTATEIELRWIDSIPIKDVLEFELMRSDDGVTFYRHAYIPPKVMRYVSRVPNPEWTYHYKIRAIGEKGANSEFGNTVIVTTPVYPWARSFGGSQNDTPTATALSADGGHILTGRSASFGQGSSSLWVLKTDRYGVPTWEKAFSGPFEESGAAVVATDDGGCVLAGTTSSFGAGLDDLWVLKIDVDGAIEWEKSYGGPDRDWAASLAATSDGGCILAGTTESFGLGASDLWVLKLGADGSIGWQKTYGGAYDDYARCVSQSADGGYIVAGETTDFGAGQSDIWIVKLDPGGIVEWEKAYGGWDFDHVSALIPTPDDGYALVGSTSSFGAGSSDLWMVKLDFAGAIEWQKTYGEAYGDYGRALTLNGDSFMVAGHSEPSGVGSSDFWVLQIAPDGSIDWQKRFGGNDDDRARGLMPLAPPGSLVIGETRSFGPAGDNYWSLRLNPNGTVEFNPSSGAEESDCETIVHDTDTEPIASAAVVSDTNVAPQDTTANVTDTSCTQNSQGSH